MTPRIQFVRAPAPLSLPASPLPRRTRLLLGVALVLSILAMASCAPEPVSEARSVVERRIVLDCKGPCFADRPKPTRLVCAEVR